MTPKRSGDMEKSQMDRLKLPAAPRTRKQHGHERLRGGDDRGQEYLAELAMHVLGFIVRYMVVRRHPADPELEVLQPSARSEEPREERGGVRVCATAPDADPQAQVFE